MTDYGHSSNGGSFGSQYPRSQEEYYISGRLGQLNLAGLPAAFRADAEHHAI